MVPEDWVERERPAAGVAVRLEAPDRAVSVVVTMEDVSAIPGLTIEQYDGAAELKLPQQLRNYRLLSKQRVVIGGHQAYRRASTITAAGGGPSALLQYYFLAGGTAHILTFACPPARLNELAPLLDLIAGSYTVGSP